MPAPDIQRSEDALQRVPFLGGTVNSDLGRAEAHPSEKLGERGVVRWLFAAVASSQQVVTTAARNAASRELAYLRGLGKNHACIDLGRVRLRAGD
jgi:hypothetical protein